MTNPTTRQSNLIRFADLHGFTAVAVEGTPDVVQVSIPGVLVATGEQCTSEELVSTMSELREVLGY